MDMGKFNPNDFETHETAFINLLVQTYGAQGENLKYIVHDVVIPAEFVNDVECTSGWTWIEPYDTMENGRGAFLAWTSHYNGQGELSKHTAMAKGKDQKSFLQE
jgi:hypothetical protein